MYCSIVLQYSVNEFEGEYLSNIFQVPLGIFTAVNVRVGQRLGAFDPAGGQFAYRTALAIIRESRALNESDKFESFVASRPARLPIQV